MHLLTFIFFVTCFRSPEGFRAVSGQQTLPVCPFLKCSRCCASPSGLGAEDRFMQWKAGIFFSLNFVKPCVARVSKLRDAPLHSSQPEKN